MYYFKNINLKDLKSFLVANLFKKWPNKHLDKILIIRLLYYLLNVFDNWLKEDFKVP